MTRAEDRLPLVRGQREVRRQAGGEERREGHEAASAGDRIDEAGEEAGAGEQRDLGGPAHVTASSNVAGV